MHVNQPLCFEGATQKIYVYIYINKGKTAKWGTRRSLFRVNERVTENLGRIRLRMYRRR